MKTNLVICFLFAAPVAFASGVKVGNGNDGRDLERLTPVDSGILIETRQSAVLRLRDLKVDKIPHLGSLIPELEKSELFLSSTDVENFGDEEHKGIGPEATRKVFARTMPEAHATTRFFPASLQLSSQQLVALHIHEALHRALPPLVRENEQVVARVTAAIMDPGATNDSVTGQVLVAVQEGALNVRVAEKDDNPMTSYGRREVRQPLDQAPRFGGSSVSYSKTLFGKSNRDESTYKSMDILSVRWGERFKSERILQVGLDFSNLQTKQDSVMGPTQLSAELQLPWRTDLNVRFGGRYTLNTLADEEYKTNPMARQVGEIMGTLSYVKNKKIYLDTDLGLISGSEQKQKMGNVEYTHKYGSTTRIGVGFGAFQKNWELGLRGEMQLMENYTISGGAFELETGPLRVVRLGPKGLIRIGDFEISANYNEVVSSTKDLALDSMGDLFGAGVGQKNFNLGVGYVF